MQSSPSRLVFAGAFAVGISCLAITGAASQQRQPGWSGPIDSLRVAQLVVETLFPELKGRRTVMLVGGPSQPFDMPVSSGAFLGDFGLDVEESNADLFSSWCQV